MKSGGHGGRKHVAVIDGTRHGLSRLDMAAFAEKEVPKGTTKLIVEETKHNGADYHEVELRYVQSGTTFLYCKAAGGSFSDVLEQLKACKKQ